MASEIETIKLENERLKEKLKIAEALCKSVPETLMEMADLRNQRDALLVDLAESLKREDASIKAVAWKCTHGGETYFFGFSQPNASDFDTCERLYTLVDAKYATRAVDGRIVVL